MAEFGNVHVELDWQMFKSDLCHFFQIEKIRQKSKKFRSWYVTAVFLQEKKVIKKAHFIKSLFSCVEFVTNLTTDPRYTNNYNAQA